jgi:hypothetical protein
MYFDFECQPYIAVIGDIVSSKKIPDRADVQKKLKSLLSDINRMYSRDIASSFVVTLGDEFQGLLQHGSHTVEIIDKIKRLMHPTKIRFGIGVGHITTEIDPSSSIGADGPAYYCARKAISELKTTEKKNMESKPDMLIDIDKYPDIAEIINTIFALNTAVTSRWTDRQREIINVYLRCGGTQSDAAAVLGIHQSNVQKALAHASFYTYQRALRSIAQLLSEI